MKVVFKKAAILVDLLTRNTSKENLQYPYRKPTQVGGNEYSKVIERTLAKELGNSMSVTSE